MPACSTAAPCSISARATSTHALADLDQAIKLDPDFAAALNDRGTIYQHKGDLDRAIADFDRAIKANPRYDVALNNRGMAYKSKGKLDRR